MASIPAPRFPSHSSNIDRSSHEFISTNSNPRFLASSSRFKKPSVSLPTFPSSSRVSESGICRCRNQSDRPSSSDDFINRRWDSLLSDVVKNAMKRWDDYMNAKWSSSKNSDSEKLPEKEKVVRDWNWDRWKRHFDEVDEQEKFASILKSQLHDAVHREDYKDATKLKVAVAAATTNDTVGRAISGLNRAVEEARYQDAAFIRDHAGAGLLGWWAGRSADSSDPYGRIIRITAEHGRYVARSYSSRQLATATPGAPLFEIFFTINEEGEYKHQAVYLRRNKGSSGDFLMKSSKPPKVSSLNSLNDSTEGKNDLSITSSEDMGDSEGRDDDADVPEGVTGIQNVLQDIIPGVKVKVLKVSAPEKVDRDLISKVIEQIMEEEDDEKDVELEDEETEDELEEEEELEDEIKAVSDKGDIEMGAGGEVIDTREEHREIAVKVVIGGLVQKLPSNISPKDLLRVPARLERKDRFSFLLSIEKDESQKEHGGKVKASLDKNSKLPSPRSINHVMSDLAKVLISGEKIPMKVLKDVGELITLTLSQAQNRQPLSGSTIFSRIIIPTTSDPLNGLYIGAHGLYTSEVIYLRRKFGHWQEDGGSQECENFEFYEYVEALKITGDPYIPAGQIAFRAKVGKQNQLPHKGIIPEEFGVVARYKGQGRLAEPGFRKPRWVEGELVILDGKYIKGGPVVGFLYWAPEYHFLVFFNRLRLQD